MICQRTGRLIAAVLFPCLLFSLRGRCQTAGPAAAMSAETRVAHISITTMGSGQPVILIPGLSSPRATFTVAAGELAVNHRVYLVQINGFGGDDPGANVQPGILEGAVAELDGYMSRNKLQGAAVVGHSMGGLIALMLAQKHPQDVGRLMVVDALPYVGDIFLPGAQVAQVEPRAKMMRDGMIASYGRPGNPDGAKKTAEGQALHEDSRAQVAGWVAAADPRVTGEAFYEDMTTDLRPQMAEIQTPITLVYPYSAAAPGDKVEPFYKAEYAKSPHVSFVAIGDSGHFVMLDQPQAFREALQAFLK